LKSNVSDHLEMVQCIYEDACAKCIADVSDLRDLLTIRSRVKDEGVSFLTITLPAYARDLEKALQVGYIDSTHFRKWRKCGLGPAFLRGLTSLIFDYETGRINDDNNNEISSIIDSVRQICLAFEKMELPCTPERVTRSLFNFTEIEQSDQLFSTPKADTDEFLSVSAMLWDNMLGDLRLDMLVPWHGPGATAEHISGNQKYVWKYWHERLEPFFPLIDTAYSVSVLIEGHELEQVELVKPEHEPPVRVVCVPKTLKGPRIIAIEPVCVQYTQQAIRAYLYDRLESFELTKGHVNFRDQSVNQTLALISSSSGLFATIDLSDASDRVPRDLALEMFRSNPDLKDAIDACRSTRAILPDGSIIGPLRKFASMGSALCFPVESMYFYTVCVAALLWKRGLPVSHRNIFMVSRDVYVYGDDIVVPSTEAIIVLDYLQKYNCKVNMAKTFVTGRFRESCGQDAFNGESVTPIRIRKDRPKNKRHVSELISWVATANLFYLKGYWRTAQLMWHTCERYLGPLPYVAKTSSALGRISYLGYRSVERWNAKLHRFEVKGWVPSPVYRSDSIDGYPALQKCLGLLQRRTSCSLLETPGIPGYEDVNISQVLKPVGVDSLHLERTALYGAVALQRHWVPA